jgi:hypothetical protein
MNKPYLLSVGSPCDGVDRYLATLVNLKDSVEWYPVNLRVYPGHLYRWDRIPQSELEEDRWWIFTDTGDVVFQREVPDLSEIKEEIIVASENTIHRGSWWEPILKDFPELEKLLIDKTIYNVGCFAMKGKMFKKWLWRITMWREKYPNPPMYLEQLLFNQFIHEQIKKKNVMEHEYLFAPLYKNLELENVMRVGKEWRTKGNELICIVHGNGSTKELL